jgi:hypothetical protein
VPPGSDNPRPRPRLPAARFDAVSCGKFATPADYFFDTT